MILRRFLCKLNPQTALNSLAAYCKAQLEPFDWINMFDSSSKKT